MDDHFLPHLTDTQKLQRIQELLDEIQEMLEPDAHYGWLESVRDPLRDELEKPALIFDGQYTASSDGYVIHCIRHNFPQAQDIGDEMRIEGFEGNLKKSDDLPLVFFASPRLLIRALKGFKDADMAAFYFSPENTMLKITRIEEENLADKVAVIMQGDPSIMNGKGMAYTLFADEAQKAVSGE